MLDGWGNRLLYAVTRKLTVTGQYDNDDGGIFINDDIPPGDDPMTSVPGNALYVLLSHGRDGKGAFTARGLPVASPCTTPDRDTANCNADAIFVASSLSQGTVFYDDIITYRSYLGGIEEAICGNQGMLYAPGHPERNAAEGCLDPSYRQVGQEVTTGDTTIAEPCATDADGFCNSSYFSLIAPTSIMNVPTLPVAPDPNAPLAGTLPPGDYLIHWDGYLRFDNPKNSQYAVLEFLADGLNYTTQEIPFEGDPCLPGPLQHQSGILSLNVENDTALEMRVRYFVGTAPACGPPAPGVPAPPPPSLTLEEVGQGAAGSVKTFGIEIFRKPQTF